MKPLASVIILALNEEKNLPNCLTAVFAQETDFPFEVLLVDSGSSDRTKQIAEGFAQKYPLRLLEIKREEFSHGKTRRFASDQAEGEFLVCLVADAVPADQQWLKKLVDAAKSDDRIAGAYSRQLPRTGAGLLEKLRLIKRKVFREARTETGLKESKEYWMMEPLARIALCDFDDVSSVRKKSVLDRIPIPDSAWAEDLVWSRNCLLGGYKIIFEPGSVARHSHSSRAFYFFRRGWADQQAAKKYFGQVYYPSFRNALGGWFYGLGETSREIFKADAEFMEKVFALFQWPMLSGVEVAGRFLAGWEPQTETGSDLIRHLSGAAVFPADAKERVAKTAFVIGDSWKKVILAQPSAIINYRMKIGKNCQLRFGIGIKPEAFRHRTAPIDFMVAVDQEPIFRRRLEMSLESLQAWKEFALDLGPWAGKRVKISLVTGSADLKYAWAGWAEPRIVIKDLSPGFSLKNYLIGGAERIASPSGFRHP